MHGSHCRFSINSRFLYTIIQRFFPFTNVSMSHLSHLKFKVKSRIDKKQKFHCLIFINGIIFELTRNIRIILFEDQEKIMYT
jgi:hypothetical protein